MIFSCFCLEVMRLFHIFADGNESYLIYAPLLE